MTTARTFKYRTNLSRKMSAPGGLRPGEAVAKAEAGLETHREAAMTSLRQRLVALEALCVALAPGSEARVYDDAAALLDLAGFFDTGPLYTAAFSLCELSDGMIEAGDWEWPPITVHVQALRLILTDDCRPTEAAELILNGLSSILERSRARG